MSLFEHWMKSAVWFCHTKTGWVVSSSLPSKTKLLFTKNIFFYFVIFCLFFLWPFCSSVAQSHRVWIHHPTPPTLSLFLSGFMLQKKGLTHDEWAPRAIGPVTWQSRCSPPIGGRGNNWALWCAGEKGAPLFSRVSEPRVWQITSLHIKHSQHLVARCRL